MQEVTAYILVAVETARVRDVLESIKKVEGVVEAHAVTGEYDIIAKMEAKDLKELGEKIIERIHRIKGVERTVTAIVVE